jgi:hypothetical protein
MPQIKIKTRSTENRKYIRVCDLVAGEYAGPSQHPEIGGTAEWSISSSSQSGGKINILVSDNDADWKLHKSNVNVAKDAIIDVDSDIENDKPPACGDEPSASAKAA